MKKDDLNAGIKNKNKTFVPSSGRGNQKFYQKRWFRVTGILLVILLVAGGIFAFKTGYILNKISDSDSSALKSLFNVLPGVGDDLKEEDGRTNILLLGMRGVNVPGGGLLADSIMVLSIKETENKVAMISVPRDLYVEVPGTSSRSKINAVHAYGEEKGQGQGLKQMEKVISEVTGLPIHYAVSINFAGFKQLIDAVGGIDLNLETAFYETNQFVEGKECGIEFALPAGQNHLDGEKALCYARARDNTSDFDRAKRQQLMLKSLKEKLISLGTLTDFGKVNGILNAIGDNVKTDMSSSEMKDFYERYAKLKDTEVYQRVFENSEEGLLMVPEDTHGAGYILIPRTGEDNYSAIHDVCQNIFTLPPQSNISPAKQKSKPKSKSSSSASSSKKASTSESSSSSSAESESSSSSSSSKKKN